MITLRNTFGKPVVEIEANKANEGAVYVSDVFTSVVRARIIFSTEGSSPGFFPPAR
jgi:hypothetical protein